jgi:mannitol-1-phosphate/altronate dehydrogenase
VRIVADVEPYELMKLRMLNASHQAQLAAGGPILTALLDRGVRKTLADLDRYV